MKDTILAIKLKEYRKSNDLTQSDLAEQLDVSDKTISKWELNRTYPSKKNMLKLTELLNISLETLLLEEKSNDLYKINIEELLSLIFYTFIIIATFLSGNPYNIFIAIICITLFIISRYLKAKSR